MVTGIDLQGYKILCKNIGYIFTSKALQISIINKDQHLTIIYLPQTLLIDKFASFFL